MWACVILVAVSVIAQSVMFAMWLHGYMTDALITAYKA